MAVSPEKGQGGMRPRIEMLFEMILAVYVHNIFTTLLNKYYTYKNVKYSGVHGIQ